ncbi:MAG: lipoyl(octanoyl) transferase LipB [Eubacteriales bacterium]|nr:lipoyl(octanoyl) transferase LipB [Eubacteriales bacterium]
MDQLAVYDLGRMPYGEALVIQRQLLQLRQKDWIGDTLLIVEHPPVLTLGTRGDYANIYLPTAQLADSGIEIFEVERGGDVTYHGPGQIVGYPIVKLAQFTGGIRSFITAMATAIIDLLRADYNLVAEQRFDKYSGVWISETKIVAIGVAVKSGVTMHGFAFNVNTNLKHFDWINPCGLSKGVTSVEHELGYWVDFDLIKKHVIMNLATAFHKEPIIHTLEDLAEVLVYAKT